MISSGQITVDNPRSPDVQALLDRHLAFSQAATPPEHSFALGAGALLDLAITFCSFRTGGELLGIGALKELSPAHGEIKSMHTAETARAAGSGGPCSRTCSASPGTGATSG